MSNEDALMMKLLRELLNTDNANQPLSTTQVNDAPALTDELLGSILQTDATKGNTPKASETPNATKASAVETSDINPLENALAALEEKVEELAEHYQKQSEENQSNVKSSLKKLQEELTALQQNQEALRRNLKELNTKEDILTEIMPKMEAQQVQYESLIEIQNQLRKEIVLGDEKNEESCQAIKQQNERYEGLIAIQNQLREVFEEFKEKQQQAQAKLQEALDDSLSQIQSPEQVQGILENALKGQKQELTEWLKHLENELNQEKNQNKSWLESLESKLEQLQEQVENLRQQQGNALQKEALESLHQNIAHLQNSQKEDRQHWQQQIPALQAQTAKLEGNLEALKGVFEFLQQQGSQNGQQAAIDLLKNQQNTLEDKIADLAKQSPEIPNDLINESRLEEKLEARENEAIEARKALEAQNASLEARISQLEQQLELLVSIPKPEEGKSANQPDNLEWQWLRQTMFRQEAQLKNYLPKSFVISADSGETFFWVGEKMGLLYLVIFRAQASNRATLSLMGNFLVNNLIIESKLMDAAAITDELNYRFHEVLKQKNEDGNETQIQFGICIADKVNDTLYFSGAGCDLLVNNKTLKRVNGETHLLGKKGAKFRKDTIPIRKGYQFFLLTQEIEESQRSHTEEIMSSEGKEALAKSTQPEINYEKGEVPYILGFSL